jgi:hypothetical protein
VSWGERNYLTCRDNHENYSQIDCNLQIREYLWNSYVRLCVCVSEFGFIAGRQTQNLSTSDELMLERFCGNNLVTDDNLISRTFIQFYLYFCLIHWSIKLNFFKVPANLHAQAAHIIKFNKSWIGNDYD